MPKVLTIKGFRLRWRHAVLAALLVAVTAVQLSPTLAAAYSKHVYPVIGTVLSHVSGLLPFSIDNVFVGLCIVWLIGFPLYSIFRRKRKVGYTLLYIVEFLLWLHVWFYGAWGLNYSQPSLYSRTGMKPAKFSATDFRDFAHSYAKRLNASFTEAAAADKDAVRSTVLTGYDKLSEEDMGVNKPFNRHPRVKTMLYTPLASMVGVTGSMAPFFCEFTLNGDLLPEEYAATYAHEFSHMLGIANEGEANFYAYLVCTASADPEIRFSGYMSILGHVLNNVYRLLGEEEYKEFVGSMRPEVKDVYNHERAYWQSKYSRTIGSVQDKIYDIYLKFNKIEGGRKSYSQVIGLLMTYRKEKDRDA